MEDETPATDAPVADAAPAVDTTSSDSTPEVTADTFGWDGWDGAEDKLPEPIRPWASRFSSHYGKTASMAQQEAERVQKIYENLMEGREDPRLAELQQQLTEHGTARTTLEQERDQYKTQLQQFVEHQNAWAQSQAQAHADAFQKANSWIFESDDLKSQALELLNEDFEDTDLPVLLRMPPDLLKVAREVHKELKSAGTKNASALALELARARYKPPTGRPAAKLTAGANGNPPSAAVPKGLTLEAPMKEWKDRAIDRALSVVKN